MSAETEPGTSDPEAASLAEDWRAIWRSEAAALALDPEWGRAADGHAPSGNALWSALWAAMWAVPGSGDAPGRGDGGGLEHPAGSGTSAGAAPAGTAPGAGGDLERRVSDLERELAELRGR